MIWTDRTYEARGHMVQNRAPGWCIFCSVWAVILFMHHPAHALDAEAAFLQQHSDFLTLQSPNDTHGNAEYLYQPGNDASDSDGDYDLSVVGLHIDIPLPQNEDTFLLIGGEYQFRDYTFDDAYQAFADDDGLILHQIRIESSLAHFFSDNLMGSATVSGGIFSDFEDGIESDAFQPMADARLVYRINSGASIIGGARISQDFGDTDLFPIVGLRLQDHSGQYHISLTAPLEALGSYHATETRTWFLRYKLAGNIYYATVADSSFDVEVRDSRLGAGIHQWLGTHVRLTIEIGASVGSRFKYDRDDSTFFRGGVDPAPFGLVGIGFVL